VFDLWADWWRRHRAAGDVIIVRFADDYTVGFEYEDDARRFLTELWLPKVRVMHSYPNVRLTARTRGRSPMR
jgi:hypothetical protein